MGGATDGRTAHKTSQCELGAETIATLADNGVDSFATDRAPRPTRSVDR